MINSSSSTSQSIPKLPFRATTQMHRKHKRKSWQRRRRRRTRRTISFVRRNGPGAVIKDIVLPALGPEQRNAAEERIDAVLYLFSPEVDERGPQAPRPVAFAAGLLGVVDITVAQQGRQEKKTLLTYIFHIDMDGIRLREKPKEPAVTGVLVGEVQRDFLEDHGALRSQREAFHGQVRHAGLPYPRGQGRGGVQGGPEAVLGSDLEEVAANAEGDGRIEQEGLQDRGDVLSAVDGTHMEHDHLRNVRVEADGIRRLVEPHRLVIQTDGFRTPVPEGHGARFAADTRKQWGRGPPAEHHEIHRASAYQAQPEVSFFALLQIMARVVNLCDAMREAVLPYFQTELGREAREVVERYVSSCGGVIHG
ncbi:hypothetical protein ANO14919_023290 [Xylariales sp. No.14919]|nr:hypothetical protein ANO14919_023290 [Xylariales sp. No.14919]